MIKITMFSSADKVAGQGVGSAYLELINLLRNQCSDKFEIEINRYGKSQISHYHTIDPLFYLSTFSKKRGRKIGYVHFLPETLEGSLTIPQPFRGLFYHYIIAFYKRMDQLVVVNPSFIKQLVAYGIPEKRLPIFLTLLIMIVSIHIQLLSGLLSEKNMGLLPINLWY